MALTFTQISREPVGSGWIAVHDVEFDDDYLAGGEAVTARDLGMRHRLDDVRFRRRTGAATYEFRWVQDEDYPDRGTIQVFRPSDRGLVGRPDLRIGTSSAAALRTSACTALVAGASVSVSAGETAFTATTHDITATSASVQEAVYLMSVNGGGTKAITKGTTATGAGEAAIPAAPAGQTAIGYARIAVAAGATDFDASSDDLDASHLTVTYADYEEAPEVDSTTDLSDVTVRMTVVGR